MLRHGVFAIVLIGAAFAGGAVVNGTGLAWFKALASGGPRIVVDGGPARGPTQAPPAPAERTNPFPTAQAPLLDLGLPPAPASDGPDSLAESPAPPPARPAAPPAAAPLVAAAVPPTLATPPAFETGPAPESAPAPLPDPAPPKSDPVARLASTQSDDAPAASAPGSAPATGPARDWAELRRRFRAAGIARYEITSEVEGQAKFSCVIPVDGLRAVGHQFEAEGDDEYQAAEAALRRIALWRATEAK
ncbi:hypothetical protein TA3x_000099 [Tundrisphaera sp. TA3]|uniref:hypothetical protein n=1 Tax=Tundrisphaera sp. TA3 TaxID=3435775 RepID=UPI003EBEAE59